MARSRSLVSLWALRCRIRIRIGPRRRAPWDRDETGIELGACPGLPKAPLRLSRGRCRVGTETQARFEAAGVTGEAPQETASAPWNRPEQWTHSGLIGVLGRAAARQEPGKARPSKVPRRSFAGLSASTAADEGAVRGASPLVTRTVNGLSMVLSSDPDRPFGDHAIDSRQATRKRPE